MSDVDEHEARGWFEVKIPGWCDGEKDNLCDLQITAVRPGSPGDEEGLNLQMVLSPFSQMEMTPENFRAAAAALLAAADYYEGKPA